MRTPKSKLSKLRECALEQERCFLGIASISCSVLSFERPGLRHDDVERLRIAFGAGCSPGKAEHQIPALIDKGDLEATLTQQGIGTEDLRQNSKPLELHFPPGYRVVCLQGNHRVAAAGQLNPPVRRWVVKLFDSTMNEAAKSDLRHHQWTEKDVEDGEFYYRIQMYRGVLDMCKRNRDEERRWWAGLDSQKGMGANGTSSKGNRLRQLLVNRDYVSAFNAFLEIPALYSGLRLTLVNKMITMKCRDELISSLRDIKQFWEAVLKGNPVLMAKLDPSSVRALGDKAPGAFPKDHAELEPRVFSGEILKDYSSEERKLLWNDICAHTKDRLVPSLWGFFKNLCYIKKIEACMPSIVNIDGHSWRYSLHRSFRPSNTEPLPVQIEPRKFKEIFPNPSDQFEIAYRQLWLYLFRSYNLMQPTQRSKVADAVPEQASGPETFVFGKLASILGFDSPAIQHLLNTDPYVKVAQRFLDSAKPPGYGKSQWYEQCLSDMAGGCSRAWIPSAETIDDDGEDDSVDESVPRNRGVSGREETTKRSGLPLLADHRSIRDWAFLNHMHDSDEPIPEALFVQRSLYRSLFACHPTGPDLAALLADAPVKEGDLFSDIPATASKSGEKTQSLLKEWGPSPQIAVDRQALHNSIESKRREEQELESSCQKLRVQEKEIETAIAGSQALLTKISAAAQARDQEIKDQEESLKSGSEVKQNLQNEINEREERVRELTVQEEALLRSIAAEEALLSERNAAEERIRDLETRKEVLEREIQEKEASLAGINVNYQQLKAQEEELDNTISTKESLRSEVNAAEERCRDLEARREELERDIQDKEASLAGINTNYQQLKAQEEELDSAISTKESLRSEVKTAEERCQDLETRKEGLEREIQEQEALVAGKIGEYEDLKARKEGLERDIQEKEDFLADKNADYGNLEANKEGLERAINEKQALLDELNARYQKLEAQKKELERYIKEKKDEFIRKQTKVSRRTRDPKERRRTGNGIEAEKSAIPEATSLDEAAMNGAVAMDTEHGQTVQQLPKIPEKFVSKKVQVKELDSGSCTHILTEEDFKNRAEDWHTRGIAALDHRGRVLSAATGFKRLGDSREDCSVELRKVGRHDES